MKMIDNYKNKNVLVLGASKSGINAARLLVKLNANVTLNDIKPLSKIEHVTELKNIGIQIIAGKQDPTILDNHYDIMVKNPGITYDNLVVKKAINIKLPIITEVELASEITNSELIGVTGSNGKTTTTTMITKMLDRFLSNGHAYAAGNIGISASKVAEKSTKNDLIIMEISSFMLLGITTLHPHIAVLTNIFSNHLDYHKTRANYVRAKMRITKNQTSNDYFVVNFDSKEWRELSKKSKAKVIPFSSTDKYQDGSYEKNGKLYFQDEYIIDAKDIQVPGQHNVENALAAIAVAKIKHCSNDIIRRVLTHFSGVRHRDQYVMSYKNRQFYNDSKSTDIEATQAALSGFNRPVVLLAGGLDRGYTFDKLVPNLKQHVKSIVLFGQTAKLLSKAAEKAGINNIKIVDNIDQAVPIAYQMSNENDVILLSPANASWDQFNTFEERGDRFIKDIEQLTGKQEEQE